MAKSIKSKSTKLKVTRIRQQRASRVQGISKSRVRQQRFMGLGFDKPEDVFGGSLLKNSNAKSKRPFDSKMPIHLVLRTERSVLRTLKTIKLVNVEVERICRKHGFKLYKYANVGNHLHLLLKIPSILRWNRFIRELTGRIAQLVRVALGDSIAFGGARTGGSKEFKLGGARSSVGSAYLDGSKDFAETRSRDENSNASKTTKKSFWKQRPFTRIVRGWNRAFRTAKEYIHLNIIEAEGFISRREIKTLKDLRAIFSG